MAHEIWEGAPRLVGAGRACIAYGSAGDDGFVSAAAGDGVDALLAEQPNWMGRAVGTARHRRARPGDALVAATLATGPIAAQAIAVPWAVGVASAGVLADPSRGQRSLTHDAPDAAEGRFLGPPQLQLAFGDAVRLEVTQTSGIPWSLGHWPWLPRLGFGGQGAWYRQQHTQQVRTLTPAEARRVAAYLGSSAWRLLHRLGLDVGPAALPVPAFNLTSPLASLAPGDSATLSVSRVCWVSVALVLGWLRLGPQSSHHEGAQLHLARGEGHHLTVTLFRQSASSAHQLIADLPAMGSAHAGYVYERRQQATYPIDLGCARGALRWLWLRDGWQRGEAQFLPYGPGPSSYSAKTQNAGAGLTLPWTLLCAQPRGWGWSRQTAIKTHERAGHALWSVDVEHEIERLGSGVDAWRLTLARSGLRGTASGGLNLNYAAYLGGGDATQLYADVTQGFVFSPRARAPATRKVSAGPVDLSVHAHLPLASLQALRAELHAAQATGPTSEDGHDVGVLQLLDAMLVACQPLEYGAASPACEAALAVALRRAGPTGLGILIGRLQPRAATHICVQWQRSAQLIHQALCLVASPASFGRARRAAAARAYAELTSEHERLLYDPLLALAGAAAVARALSPLGEAQRRLARAVPDAARPPQYGAILPATR